MEFTTTVEIASDIDTVWDALADPRAWPTWMDEVKDVEPTGGTGEGAPRYGAEYTVRQAWWKLSDQTLQITEFDRPNRFAFSASTTAGEVVFEYTLGVRDSGLVAVDHVARTQGILATVSGALSGPMIQRQLVKEAASLRDHCQRVAPQDAARS